MIPKTSKFTQNPIDKFNTFILQLVDNFKPLQIYSFCKIIKVENKTGCFMPDLNMQHQHYFLLMIMESSTKNEHQAQEFCRSRFGDGKITILSHGIQTIKESIRKNNRFFISILNQGHLLYNQAGFFLAQDKILFDSSQNHEKAKKHFEHCLKLARGFLETANECYFGDHLEISIFLMHQAVEQLTIGLLMVNLGYRSDIHHLGRQLDLCCSFSSAPSDIFRSTLEDIRIFEILLKSYSQVRYKDNFTIDFEDAGKLRNKVGDLLKLTEQICSRTILEFQKEDFPQKKSEVHLG